MPRNLLRHRQTLRHQKAVDASSDAVVGYARWILPSARAVTAGGEPEWAEAQVPGNFTTSRSTPKTKVKGSIGTALVQSGIHQAERMGLDIFTLAFKMGRGIYERLGFKEVERMIQDDSAYGGLGEYGAYFMVYQCPRKR
ncbi:hypothetical protein F4779DRAFT_633168 [Xylariaceae sp. FL0662B]|nr:hypothetical protein F4779DRAFT_633168 [Xylariaceae sp. FL0662B]